MRPVFLWLCFSWTACSINDVPLQGLACPCATGWACESHVCVPSGVGCGGPGAEPGSLVFLDFSQRWTTPNTVRVQWTLQSYDDASHYELELAANRKALIAREDVRTIDGTINPELSRVALARTRSDSDLVDATTATGLLPDMPYAFRLLAFDTAGGVSCSDIVSTFTPSDALDEIVLAELGTIESGFMLPECLATDGAHRYEYACERTETSDIATCDTIVEAGVECWENIRLIDASHDVRTMSDGDFASAFLEIEMSLEDLQDAYWLEPAVQPAGRADYQTVVTMRSDASVETLQLPLRNLVSTEGAGLLNRAALGDEVVGFRVGTSAAHGSKLAIYRAAIRF